MATVCLKKCHGYPKRPTLEVCTCQEVDTQFQLLTDEYKAKEGFHGTVALSLSNSVLRLQTKVQMFVIQTLQQYRASDKRMCTLTYHSKHIFNSWIGTYKLGRQKAPIMATVTTLSSNF